MRGYRGFMREFLRTGSPRALALQVRVGVAHVALGSDYDGTVAVTFHSGELIVLTEEMLRAGFIEQEIRPHGEQFVPFSMKQLFGVRWKTSHHARAARVQVTERLVIRDLVIQRSSVKPIVGVGDGDFLVV